MKTLLLLPILALPLLYSGCEAVLVDDRPVRRTAYVERDVRYRDSRDGRIYDDNRYRDDRDVVVVNPRTRRNVVVVDPRPNYQPQVQVRYYNDTRGRYYIRDGRRIYSSSSTLYDAQFHER